jgi:hypothetical protein
MIDLYSWPAGQEVVNVPVGRTHCGRNRAFGACRRHHPDFTQELPRKLLATRAKGAQRRRRYAPINEDDESNFTAKLTPSERQA